MKKNKISSYFLFISIFTLITIFLFIIHRGYSKLIDPVRQVQTGNLSKPLDPVIKLDILEKIKQKQEFLPDDLSVPTPTLTPTLTISP